MESFEYSAAQARVIFGSGTAARLRDEVLALKASRVLLLAGPAVANAAQQAREVLGPLLAGHFDAPAMHTPVEVTEKALQLLTEVDADCLVAIGGGSTVGLGKALALRTDLPQIALPTTYAGSEVTPVLGQTEHGVKTTITSPAVLPEIVIYDIELSRYLPLETTVTSGINALAHAVEALYSVQANPVTDLLAQDAIGRIARALPVIARNPSDEDARGELLHGAWLAGICLGSVGMALQHKLAHTVGGSLNLPHAATHTVLLPYTLAYNAPAAPDAMSKIAAALGTPDAPSGVFDLISALPAPTSLRTLGLAETDIPRVAALAAARPYPNPREITEAGIAGVLRAAWAGERPSSSTSAVPDLTWLTDEVVASFASTPDPRVRELLSSLVRSLHRYAISNDLTEQEWAYAIDFLTRTGQIATPTRQEFVLLSDTLGVSSVVDALTNSRTPDTTPSAVLGPFYVDGPPSTELGADIAGGLPGTPLYVNARITDPDGNPIPGAIADVWQSNEDGFYDVQLPDLDGPVLRARFTTDEDGGLRFWSILPSAYPIPADGPVGQMLGAVGRHPYRAPHVHFMIMAPGYQKLITQLFVAGGDYLDSDTVFGVKEGLIVDFVPRTGPTPDGGAVDGEWRSLDFTFHIAPVNQELP
ncbi:MAG TPA: maleylacetate reductase and hydroxyquinol 1,2-dioxygenase domain-containing protein [Pseudonocardiaceae bacterium]|nr:maleylacetate reductase and hydroxyquinol 1,2-dioxygenase domain-containing protein [Pseudonocardiaceae bacterium]